MSELAERCFARGRDAPENATCPYADDTEERHWWTRGFAYTSRLLRAIRAEARVRELQDEIDDRDSCAQDRDTLT